MASDRHGNERIALTDDDFRFVMQDDDDTIQQGYTFFGIGHVADEGLHQLAAREAAEARRRYEEVEQKRYLGHLALAAAILRRYRDDGTPMQDMEELWLVTLIAVREQNPWAAHGMGRLCVRRAVESAWREYRADAGDLRGAVAREAA